ncbi:semaphorin-2a [Plakobranchus ocellatus]|uniref:Semaphorin-2a n=1 Tax=Plakobranchus ocellatus TaxID=259542 RepID=A0AAV4D1R7_9GAST|nr:semaphorin-2a [Plakobranchus ocellatus]
MRFAAPGVSCHGFLQAWLDSNQTGSERGCYADFSKDKTVCRHERGKGGRGRLSRNRIYGLYLKNIENKSKRLKQEFRPATTSTDVCRKNGKAENPDCQNHIRFLVRNSSSPNPDTFYMCSTGAYKPTAYELKLSNNRFVVLKGELSGYGICPFDPNDNTTAVLVENGGPSRTTALFTGSVKDFLKSDPLIFRPAVYRNNILIAEHVRTRDRIGWLNEPQYVGSFEVGDYVYFFYREVALEYTNCGKKIYSRVARVCKSDEGGNQGFMKNTWVSFLKARLNCSIPGEYPYYFDEIQDVYRVGDMFYALFTTNANGLTASAICGYSLKNINSVFEGSFKQGNTTSIWLPVPENEVPDPRPGDCRSASYTSMQQDYTNKQKFRAQQQFVSQHSMLMDKAVSHQFREPIFFKGNCLMRKLVAIPNVAGGEGMVFFTASNTGIIYKIAAWPKINPEYDPPTTYLVTTYVPMVDKKPMWSLIFHDAWIYFGTDTAVGQLPVETCDKYIKIDLCIYDPFCGWDSNLGECRSNHLNINLISYKKIDLLAYSLEEAITKTVGELYSYEKISKITGSSVALRVAYRLHISGSVRWTHNGSGIQGDRHILAQDNSLIITDIRQPDEGRYTAKDNRGRIVAEYSLVVETNKEQIEQRWMRKFDQWCDEFERYQEDIRQWEKKCTACCEESSRANMIPALGGH